MAQSHYKHNINNLWIPILLSLQESESPERHFSYVWKNIIEKTAASKMFVVAHSYGGYLVVDYVSYSFLVTIFF